MSNAPTPDDGYIETSVTKVSLRTALVLLVFTLAFTALMAGMHAATESTLAASAQAQKLRLINEVLPPDHYDNDLLHDAITLPANELLGLTEATSAYRARKGGQPVALVIEAAAPDGYSGRIGLLLAISAQGRVIAMRVTQHRETPGLGDYIDPKKDRNKQRPWITQFNERGFDDIPAERWRVKKDGGHFDQMNGATISARAVTNASRRALEWVVPRANTLYALPAGATFNRHPPEEAAR